MPEAVRVLPDTVNKHYLEKVMDIADEMEVEAIEDIFDSRGMKLIAKGARISRTLQEKLIVHKLSKPLESCIAIEGSVDIQTVVTEARRIVETVEPIGYILRATESGGQSPFDILARLQFGNAMSMMLTITERGGSEAFSHSVMVSLLSLCLARKLGLTEKDQSTVALAGLLHDIGELYIDPIYLNPDKRLSPHEWRHIIVHPRIGQMLIEELEDYSPAVALAVAEHHERFDGAGYPRRVAGKNISIGGQVLSVAEMISGVLVRRDNPLERAEMALKIIPHEQAPQLVSVVSNALRLVHPAPAGNSEMAPDEAHERAKILFNHISTVVDVGDRMGELPVIRSNQGKALLSLAAKRVGALHHAFISTGLDVCAREDTAQNPKILFESIVATKEIQWRLRDVARDLALNSTALDAGESEAFRPLIAMLDSEPGRKSVALRSVGKEAIHGQGADGDDSIGTPKPERTLLLVDDEPNVLTALGRLLRPTGYRILTAPDAATALDLLEKNEIGVVLSDHRMPGMTGIELLSRVKTMYPLTVRMILSGYADMETVTDAIKLGAVYKFMTKPWEEAELNAALEKAFELYENELQIEPAQVC